MAQGAHLQLQLRNVVAKDIVLVEDAAYQYSPHRPVYYYLQWQNVKRRSRLRYYV